ncbi:MAG: hypothetical protein F6K22_28730 [Okeania sp. SIO2F4]|uniref:hypothetical protein n=1 Tax=Okeania sp. SIO2F4 TaxID=2607790 RepID=UPI00142A19AA|nr:hypothetical protein [Okeania sp. SIO2F4]NES06449.1 hypothetical protein [Okeania sp. SIO2F4]
MPKNQINYFLLLPLFWRCLLYQFDKYLLQTAKVFFRSQELGVIPFIKKNSIPDRVGKCGECGECGEVGTLHATSVQHKNNKH